MAGDAIEFDITESLSWQVELGMVGLRIYETLPKAFHVTLMNMKQEAQASVRSARGHIPHIADSIDYDVETRQNGVYGEVGYNRNKVQGNLGHIIEYGRASYDAPNAPQRNVGKAADNNMEDFISGVRKAAIDALQPRRR